METQNDNVVAEDIAENLLYRTGLALKHGYYDGVEDCFILPQGLETLEGARIVRTPDDVQRIFETIRSYFEEVGVIDVVRTIVEATFVSEAEIETIHVSRLITHDEKDLKPPYPVYNSLKRCDDGVWRIAHSHYTIPNSRGHSSALLSWRTEPKPQRPQSGREPSPRYGS